MRQKEGFLCHFTRSTPYATYYMYRDTSLPLYSNSLNPLVKKQQVSVSQSKLKTHTYTQYIAGSMMSTTSRSRTKWHPPQLPPPSPEVLHFPRRRRTRRKQTKPTNLHLNTRHRSKSLLLLNRLYLSSSSRGNLENLFDEENDELPKTNGSPVLLLGSYSKPSSVERRDRVEKMKECGEYSGRGGSNIFEEEKWMFQAEILRAECNLLRMEREFALKKLERNRVKMEKTLRSAVQTLVSVSSQFFFYLFIIYFF